LRVTSALEETPLSDFDIHNPSTGASILQPSLLSAVKTSSQPALSFKQVVKLASQKANESGDRVHQQDINAKLEHIIKSQEESNKLQEESNKSQEEMKQLQKAFDAKHDEMNKSQEEMKQLQKAFEAKQDEMNKSQEEMKQLQKAFEAKQDEMNKSQEEMKQLQKAFDAKQDELKQLTLETKEMQQRALDQLAVLQSRVQAVLTQTYELHEYPIPRLFVVLPQDPSGWDVLNPFSNKFHLYFLCECGEHTKSISSKTEISHDILFAKHEGYEIVRPSEFFQQYGPYALTMLKMLKYGIFVAGVAVPAISHLFRSGTIDQVTAGLQQLRDNIEPGMDNVIDWMDRASLNEGEAVDEFAKQMEKKGALEGADLRKLDTFLKDKDGNKVLGNLYRAVTDEGHVKWVCIDHYRVNYQENSAKEFLRVLDSVGGSFSENFGSVEVRLQSRVLAEQFFSALGKARSIYELNINLDWACSTSDLEALEDALKNSRVSILRLDLQQFRMGVTSKLLSTSTQYDFIFRIRDLPNMKLLRILLSTDLVKFLGFPQKKSSPACKLSCELASRLIGGKEFVILAEALKTNSTLTTLDLYGHSIRNARAKALAEALKTNSALTTLNLQENLIGSDGAKALAEALKTNSALTTLDLRCNSIGDDGAKALSKVSKASNITIEY